MSDSKTKLTKMFLTDPSVLFALSVIIAPLGLVNYPQLQIDASIKYLMNPAIIGCTVLWLAIEIFCSIKSKKSVIAHWYLMNGIFFHLLLDPLSGLFQITDLMSTQYGKLDKRYILPFDDEGLIVNLVSLLELIFMAPICLYIYYGYYKYFGRKNKKNITNTNAKRGILLIYSLEIIVSTLQLIGTFFYDGQELIHIIKGDGKEIINIDYNLSFTFEHIFYFWFGFIIAQLPWIFVPIFMIKRSIKDIAAIISKQ